MFFSLQLPRHLFHQVIVHAVFKQVTELPTPPLRVPLPRLHLSSQVAEDAKRLKVTEAVVGVGVVLELSLDGGRYGVVGSEKTKNKRKRLIAWG